MEIGMGQHEHLCIRKTRADIVFQAIYRGCRCVLPIPWRLDIRARAAVQQALGDTCPLDSE
eukprot:1332899-Amorphochlora_amoeboformis.AAC.1